MDNVRREFGLRLSGLIRDRGWNQSEAARRAEMGRDNISGYVRGRYLPGARHLHSLCKAFGVEPEELIPNREALDKILSRPSSGTPTNSTISLEELENGNWYLRLQHILPYETAMKIVTLVKESETT